MKKYNYILFLFLIIPSINFAQSWEKSKVNNWNFEILLPSNSQQAIDNEACVLIGKEEKHKYQVIVKKNQVSEIQTLLKESINGFIDDENDKIITNQNIKVDNYPAKELRLNTSKGKQIIMRVIIAKNKTFMLIVSAPQLDETDVKKFFNSFSID
ncbi:MAG: hypothetical protein EAZ06_00380 [Cytophagales bacterium]|nr:MAG: hypothetical protein EAZ06_00380 [Cytophagales bacterium]